MGSLEDILNREDIVRRLRNSRIGMYIYPVVAPEFSNWRDEQRAWRQSAVLYDQSHHMDEVIVEGPDAAKFLERLAINSFANFGTDRAKHFVPVSPEGYVIGDMICFREEEDRFVLVGRAPTANWVEYNGTLGARVKITRDPRSPSRPDGNAVTRVHYRFQIQGPQANAVLERINGGPVPDIRFFHVDWINVGRRRVRALHHGMAGALGLEIWGPYAEKDAVREVILEAAAEAGVDLRQVGARAYSTNTVESGWIPSLLPAIYTGEALKPYRQWLKADSYEANGSIGGSFVSDDIRDYYTTPYDLGYGMYVRFDHDFVGREALERMKDRPHRKKVTFEWDAEDVVKVIASAFQPGDPCKWIDFPQPNYASSSFDRVMRGDRLVGLSMFNGYSFNERCMLSLGVVEPEVRVGDQLTLVWGEPDGGSGKTSTERHRQAEIRVRVAPTPYSQEAREHYAEGWRTRH